MRSCDEMRKNTGTMGEMPSDAHMGRRPMLKESLYEQIVIVVDRVELAQLLRADPEFEIETIDDRQEKIYFTLGRKTDLYEEIPTTEETRPKPMEKLF
jgi:hypothetical protein